jgi:hypothetical protein
MIAYRQRKAEEEEDRRQARLEGVNGDAENHKPLSEILEALKARTEPQVQQQPSQRRSWG